MAAYCEKYYFLMEHLWKMRVYMHPESQRKADGVDSGPLRKKRKTITRTYTCALGVGQRPTELMLCRGDDINKRRERDSHTHIHTYTHIHTISGTETTLTSAERVTVTHTHTYIHIHNISGTETTSTSAKTDTQRTSSSCCKSTNLRGS